MFRRLFLLEVLACTLIKAFKYTVIEKVSKEAFQALWVELHLPKEAHIICGVVHRQHNSPEHFQEYFDQTIEKLNASGKKIIFMSDTNLKSSPFSFNFCKCSQNFVLSAKP